MTNGANLSSYIDSIVSLVMQQGLFERVNKHEPKNAPGRGLNCAVWVQSIEPARGGSGLNQTTLRMVLNVRVYSSMLQEPQDAIDPALIDAVSTLMTQFNGNFLDLNDTYAGNGTSLMRNVDLLGTYGQPLSVQAGYVTVDNRMFRVMTITLPLIINDIFDQEA